MLQGTYERKSGQVLKRCPQRSRAIDAPRKSELLMDELTGARDCLRMMSEVVLHQRSVPGPNWSHLRPLPRAQASP